MEAEASVIKRVFVWALGTLYAHSAITHGAVGGARSVRMKCHVEFSTSLASHLIRSPIHPAPLLLLLAGRVEVSVFGELNCTITCLAITSPPSSHTRAHPSLNKIHRSRIPLHSASLLLSNMSEGVTKNTGLVHNSISENDTGYIKKEKLEEKLRRLFRKEIRVRVSRSLIPRGSPFLSWR